MRKPTKCYIAGSGEYGCIHDYVTCHSSKESAIAELIERFGLARSRRAGLLRRNLYLDLNPHRDGAQYCEIIEADSVNENWDSVNECWKECY